MTSCLLARPQILVKINMARVSEKIRCGLEDMTSPFQVDRKLRVESLRHITQPFGGYTTSSFSRKNGLDDCQNKQQVGMGE